MQTRDFLNKNNITYWLDSGSLLGAMRNCKFIPWDDDMDFGIFFKDFLNLEKTIKTLPLVEDLYYSEKEELYFRIDNRKKETVLPIKSKVNVIKVYSSKDKKVFVDIIIYHRIGNTYRVNSKVYYQTCLYFNKKEILPLKKKKFENFYFNIPKDPYPYLDHQYWFWKHLGVASHGHFEEMIKLKDRHFYYIL